MPVDGDDGYYDLAKGHGRAYLASCGLEFTDDEWEEEVRCRRMERDWDEAIDAMREDDFDDIDMDDID